MNKDTKQLASFPEQNPNPVLEITPEGEVRYCNPACKKYFPDIEEKGMEHALFAGVREYLKKPEQIVLNGSSCEVNVGELVFEQKIFFAEDINVIRVYSSDITERKKVEAKLSWLALFPEQNPNPVLEADTNKGTVTYMNPAAREKFPEMEGKGCSHPLFAEINKRLSINKDFQCEVFAGTRVYAQRIYFLPGTALIRVYSNDITEQKQIEKNLSRLASFPEQNPSPIIEVDMKMNITYFNPACLIQFPEFYEQKFEHPVLRPLKERFPGFTSGSLANYEIELKIGAQYFTQRARLLQDSGVIRMFNLDITDQKRAEEIIKEKNKDITDSINYAKKIQQSILPSEELLRSNFTEAFVLYKPKDIISGDFYWYTTVDDYFIFACADCTGHGVPGALMSMVGSNLLSHIVSERIQTTPGTVLMELDKRVRKLLHQDDEPESRDGMDIAFCSIQKKKLILHYSAANRPMALLRKGKIVEYVPSKFPIGGQFNMEKRFEENKINLEKGDVIFLFTDGFTDQFGGPKGKKFMKKNFYALLEKLDGLSMPERKEDLLRNFDEWKGTLEQVDDVLVIGIKI
jgi:serine phosphatase RsbU (regulator of sigma subunit)/PAS domain-containing protein